MGVGGLRESLVVRLMGPALAVADVTTEEGDVTRWRVTYRVWDAGNYSVLAQSECDTLDFAPDYMERVKSTKSHVMAQWVLTVLPSTKPATEPVSEPATKPTTEPSTEPATESIAKPVTEPATSDDSQPSSTLPRDAMDGPDSPCDHSIHGRWLFSPQQKAYTWQLYPCAHPLPPTSQWLSALQSRGISEINFVGDSHVRFLFHHFYFLLTGKANASTYQYHWDIHLVVPPPSPELQPLKLNFYWNGGMFVNGSFGCRNENITSFEMLKFPNISTTAQVTLVDGADVTAEEGDVTRWRVTYRVWDAGNYSVLVQSECDTLDFAPDYLERVKSTKSHVMAQWILTVLPSTKSASEPAAAAESQLSSIFSQEATDGPDSPCDHSIHGRWLFSPQQKAYTWQLYPCAQPLPPTSQWLSALQSRGISEINFVGDSHLRFLFHHLYFLITGKANASTVKLHGDIRLVVPPPSPELQPLKLNFYWIGGIFVDGHFGCV
ncbi:unnamed protein product [Closterium sp. Yama58-4]|nr:unnamed protein product [Closterium sp. Yama58-4]